MEELLVSRFEKLIIEAREILDLLNKKVPHEGEENAIPIRNNKKKIIAYTIVSPHRYEEFSKMTWYQNNEGYVKDRQYIHRHIKNAQVGQQVDHKNGDKLDNRDENLRFATSRQNRLNRKKGIYSSIYLGVSWNKITEKWRGDIKFSGKRLYLGTFASDVVDGVDIGEIRAAKVRDSFIRNNYTKEDLEFVIFNFPEQK